MLSMENLKRLHDTLQSIDLLELGDECSEKLHAISARYSALVTKVSGKIDKLEELNKQDGMLMKTIAHLKRKENLVQIQIAEKTELLTKAKAENLSCLRKQHDLSVVLKRVESVVGNYQGCVLKRSLGEQKAFVESRTAELKQNQVDRLVKQVQIRSSFLEGGFFDEKRRTQEEARVQLEQMQKFLPIILGLLKPSWKPSNPSTIGTRKPTIVISTSQLSSIQKSNNLSLVPVSTPLDRKKKSVRFNLTIDHKRLEEDDLLLYKSIQKVPPTPKVALPLRPIKHEMASGPPPGVHPTEDKFWCTCGANYYQKKGLIRHMCSHNYGRIFQCPECWKSFALHSSMKLHLEKTHGVFEMDHFGCRACGKTFPEFRLLRNHRIEQHDLLNSRKLSMSQRRKKIRKEVRNEMKLLEIDLDDGEESDDSLDVNLLFDDSIGACA